MTRTQNRSAHSSNASTELAQEKKHKQRDGDGVVKKKQRKTGLSLYPLSLQTALGAALQTGRVPKKD